MFKQVFLLSMLASALARPDALKRSSVLTKLNNAMNVEGSSDDILVHERMLLQTPATPAPAAPGSPAVSVKKNEVNNNKQTTSTNTQIGNDITHNYYAPSTPPAKPDEHASILRREMEQSSNGGSGNSGAKGSDGKGGNK
jgi:hypothetical protein